MHTPTGVLTPEERQELASVRSFVKHHPNDRIVILLRVIDRLTASAEQSRREALEEALGILFQGITNTGGEMRAVLETAYRRICALITPQKEDGK